MAASFLSKVSEFFGLESEEMYDDFVDDTPEYETYEGENHHNSGKLLNFRQSRLQNSANSRRAQKTNARKPTSRTLRVANNDYARVKKAPTNVDRQEEFKKSSPGNVVPLRKDPQKTAFSRRPARKQLQKNEENFENSSTRPQQLFSKIAIKEPRVYSEALTIAKLLMADEAVLINFHLMEEPAASRVIDFLTGTVFALDGDIQRVGNEIFLVTSNNMEIDADVARSLLDEDLAIVK